MRETITEAGKQRFFFQLLGSFHMSIRAKTSLEFVYVGWISERISYNIAVPPRWYLHSVPGCQTKATPNLHKLLKGNRETHA